MNLIFITPNPELVHKSVERIICTHFGCGKQLTLQESLAGTRCVNHLKQEPIDITKIIKFK